jgi:hypothetical protein
MKNHFLSRVTLRTLFACAFFVILGNAMSLQAQTIQDLGEVGASDLEAVFNNEVSLLEAELNQTPPNVNVEHNESLIQGYNYILKSFFEGDDLQTTFVSFLESGVLQLADDENSSASEYTNAPNLNNGNPLQDVVDFVESWDVRSSDVSDVNETFSMIRTIKNQ